MKFDARRLMRDLEERVSRLEQLLEAFKGMGEYANEIPFSAPTRPGPKPAHVWSIRMGRDHLVRMLEDYWPEIEPFCIPQSNGEGLRRVLWGVAKAALGRHELPAKHILKHLPEVVKFLSGDRFRSDPRQIANAFAGFPQISVWRSLKICQADPCMDPIGNRAIRAYIRRKHSGLYGDLQADFSLVNFASALKRYRSSDRNLQIYRADALYKCWNDCVPNYENLKIASDRPM